MKELIKIRCKNNKKTAEFPIGSTLSEIFPAFGLQMPYGPVSAKVNNKVEGLNMRLYHNKDVEFLDLTSASGNRAYTRTLFFVLCKAVHDLYPHGSVVIDIPVSNGYYCDLTLGRPVTQQDVDALRGRMQQIIDAHYVVRRHECTTEEAMRIFEERGTSSKVKLLKSLGRLYTTYYDIDGYADYYYGSLLPNTGDLHLFGLEKYYDGMLLRCPMTSSPDRLGELIMQDKMFGIFQEHHRWQKLMGISTVGDFNDAVARGGANMIVNVAEALQEKKIAHIAEQIAARGNVKLVMISGPSSSGKTTTCKRLAIQLVCNGIRPVMLSLDDYFVDREQTPRDEKGDSRRRGGAAPLRLPHRQERQERQAPAAGSRPGAGDRGYPCAQSRTHRQDTRRNQVQGLRLGPHHHPSGPPQLHTHHRQPPAAAHHTRP